MSANWKLVFSLACLTLIQANPLFFGHKKPKNVFHIIHLNDHNYGDKKHIGLLTSIVEKDNDNIFDSGEDSKDTVHHVHTFGHGPSNNLYQDTQSYHAPILKPLSSYGPPVFSAKSSYLPPESNFVNSAYNVLPQSSQTVRTLQHAPGYVYNSPKKPMDMSNFVGNVANAAKGVANLFLQNASARKDYGVEQELGHRIKRSAIPASGQSTYPDGVSQTQHNNTPKKELTYLGTNGEHIRALPTTVENYPGVPVPHGFVPAEKSKRSQPNSERSNNVPESSNKIERQSAGVFYEPQFFGQKQSSQYFGNSHGEGATSYAVQVQHVNGLSQYSSTTDYPKHYEAETQDEDYSYYTDEIDSPLEEYEIQHEKAIPQTNHDLHSPLHDIQLQHIEEVLTQHQPGAVRPVYEDQMEHVKDIQQPLTHDTPSNEIQINSIIPQVLPQEINSPPVHQIQYQPAQLPPQYNPPQIPQIPQNNIQPAPFLQQGGHPINPGPQIATGGNPQQFLVTRDPSDLNPALPYYYFPPLPPQQVVLKTKERQSLLTLVRSALAHIQYQHQRWLNGNNHNQPFSIENSVPAKIIKRLYSAAKTLTNVPSAIANRLRSAGKGAINLAIWPLSGVLNYFIDVLSKDDQGNYTPIIFDPFDVVRNVEFQGVIR